MKVYRFLSWITAISMVLSFAFVPGTPAMAVAEAPQANRGSQPAPIVLSPLDQAVGPTTTKPGSGPELVVDKTADSDVVEANQTIGFTVTVTNTSTFVQHNVVIYDPYLAPGTTWNVDDTEHCQVVEGTTVYCQYPTLDPGASVSVHITGVATPQMCGVIQNKAWAWSDEVYRVRSPWVYVTIICGPDVQVTKTAEANTINPGERARFIITVSNGGSGPAQDVRLDDPLPGVGDTPLAWEIDDTGNGDQCSIANGVLSCNFGSLEVGETRTVSVSAVVPGAVCGEQIVNQVTVTAANESESASANNTNGATIHMNCTTLELEKQADATGVGPDSPIGFTITVRNVGDFAASNVVIHDQLAAGPVWEVDNTACVIDANGLMTCTFASLAPDTEIRVHVTTTATPELCGTLVNTASVTADGLSQELQAEADIFIDCCIDVSITKRASDISVFPGERASYTLTVTSGGDGIAEDVTLTDVLPAGLAWTEDSEFCTISGGTLSCAFGRMWPDDRYVVNLLSDPINAETCGEVIVNEASVAAPNEKPTDDVPDVNTNNNDTAEIMLGCATFQVNKTATYPVVGAGEVMEFEIMVSNGTASAINNVVLTDELDQGTTWIENSRSCSISAGVLTCNFGTLASHATNDVTIRGYATEAMCGTQWENTASATATGLGPVYGSDTVSVTCAPDVRVTKTAQPSRVTVGQNARYRLLVSNIGSADATGIELEDVLPGTPGLAWVIVPSVESPSCSITGGVLSCNFGTLAAGEDLQIAVEAPVTLENCGAPITNTATVTSSGDSNSENDSDSAAIQLNCNPLTVTKTADDSLVGLEQSIGFTITVNNGSTVPAQNVVIQDDLGTLTTWMVDGDNAESCAIVDGLMTCTFAEVAPQTSVTVHVTGAVTESMCPETNIVNEATVTSNTYTGTAIGTATVTVQCAAQEPDLQVTKTAESAAVWLNEATPTGTVRFTIEVENIGLATATGVTLTDALPQPISGDVMFPNPGDLPDLLTWVIDATGDGGSCSISADTLTCNFGSLAANATRTVAVSAPVDLETFSGLAQQFSIRSPQLVINEASVTATNESSPANNTDTDQVDLFFPGALDENPTCFDPVLFYQNDFQGNETGTATWANNRLTTSPARQGYTPETFLGEYGNEQVNFGFTAPGDTVADEDHRFVKVTFDLYVLRSWDGQREFIYGPDSWQMSLLDENNQVESNILQYTFSNYNETVEERENAQQSYPFPSVWNLTTEGRSGAKAVNALSYEFRGVVRNTTYEISYYLPRTADPVNLGFSAAGLQTIDDESWGIDNVKLETCILDPQLIMTNSIYLPYVGVSQ